MSFLTSSMSFLTARIDGVEEYIKNCIDPNEKNNYKPRRNDYVLLGGTITCKGGTIQLHEKELILLNAKYPSTGTVTSYM